MFIPVTLTLIWWPWYMKVTRHSEDVPGIKCTCIPRTNFQGQHFHKLQHEQDRHTQTHTHTNTHRRDPRHYHPHSRLVIIFHKTPYMSCTVTIRASVCSKEQSQHCCANFYAASSLWGDEASSVEMWRTDEFAQWSTVTTVSNTDEATKYNHVALCTTLVLSIIANFSSQQR